jgi:hypothetical protein
LSAKLAEALANVKVTAVVEMELLERKAAKLGLQLLEANTGCSLRKKF